MMLMNSEIAAPVKGLREARERLLRPAVGFRHPMEVVKDPDLDLADKRAILSSWASDACALVLVGEVLQALRRLDGVSPVIN
jgi:hypothetical protein